MLPVRRDLLESECSCSHRLHILGEALPEIEPECVPGGDLPRRPSEVHFPRAHAGSGKLEPRRTSTAQSLGQSATQGQPMAGLLEVRIPRRGPCPRCPLRETAQCGLRGRHGLARTHPKVRRRIRKTKQRRGEPILEIAHSNGLPKGRLPDLLALPLKEAKPRPPNGHIGEKKEATDPGETGPSERRCHWERQKPQGVKRDLSQKKGCIKRPFDRQKGIDE